MCVALHMQIVRKIENNQQSHKNGQFCSRSSTGENREETDTRSSLVDSTTRARSLSIWLVALEWKSGHEKIKCTLWHGHHIVIIHLIHVQISLSFSFFCFFFVVVLFRQTMSVATSAHNSARAETERARLWSVLIDQTLEPYARLCNCNWNEFRQFLYTFMGIFFVLMLLFTGCCCCCYCSICYCSRAHCIFCRILSMFEVTNILLHTK